MAELVAMRGRPLISTNTTFNNRKCCPLKLKRKVLADDKKTLEDRGLSEKCSTFVSRLRQLSPRQTRSERSIMFILYLKT